MFLIKPFFAYRFNSNINSKNQLRTFEINFQSINKEDNIDEYVTNSILIKDSLPAIYPYLQTYNHPTSNKLFKTWGFFASLGLTGSLDNIDFHEEVNMDQVSIYNKILNNEKITPPPVHLLYTDSNLTLESYLVESLNNKVCNYTDENGVNHKLGVLHDKKIIDLCTYYLKSAKLTIADGHHRIKASYCKGNDSNPYFIPAFFTNTFKNDITILPYHRIIRLKSNCIVNDTLLEFFRETSDSIVEADCSEINDKETCLYLKNSNCIFKKTWDKGNLFDKIEYYKLLFKKLALISEEISFTTDIEIAKTKLKSGEADLIVVIDNITIEEVMQSGKLKILMPEKMTYFYPKIPDGWIIQGTSSKNNLAIKQCFRN